MKEEVGPRLNPANYEFDLNTVGMGGNLPRYRGTRRGGDTKGVAISAESPGRTFFGTKKGIVGVIEGDESVSLFNQREIRFLQDTADNVSRGGYKVLENAEALRKGTIRAVDLPTIRVFRDVEGRVWTLDHRRLVTYRLANLGEVPVKWVSAKEVGRELGRKLTTRTEGTSIELLLERGNKIGPRLWIDQ